MSKQEFDPNADDSEMRERRAARERFEFDVLGELVDYANSLENKPIPHLSSWCIQEFHSLCGDIKCKCECHMNKPETPFEKFEQLAKTVVRVPKKEIIKSHKKLVAKKEQKRAAYKKSKKKKPKE